MPGRPCACVIEYGPVSHEVYRIHGLCKLIYRIFYLITCIPDSSSSISRSLCLRQLFFDSQRGQRPYFSQADRSWGPTLSSTHSHAPIDYVPCRLELSPTHPLVQSRAETARPSLHQGGALRQRLRRKAQLGQSSLCDLTHPDQPSHVHRTAQNCAMRTDC